MTGHAPAASSRDRDDVERRTVRRVARRVVPLMIVMYVACYLDRVNVGFAALQMNRALGLSAAAYGVGAGAFFAGYMLFEVPSNLALARVGARRWMARIMVSWGVLSCAMLLARGPVSFAALRFLLGVTEAGFFPGMVWYVGEWFPGRARARVVATFMTAIPIAGIVGGPLSGTLLGLNGRLGLGGWQWLFLLEGLPSVLIGLGALRWLPDRPATAAWLAPDERAWLIARLRAECDPSAPGHHSAARGAMVSPTVWQLALLQSLTITAGLYALGFWLPQILKAFAGFTDLRVGLVAALPYVAGIGAMLTVGAHSDAHGERLRHVAACSTIAAAGFGAAALLHAPVLAVVALAVAASGVLGSPGPFWALPSTFLSGEGAAAGIALINSVGNVMGLIVPPAMGLLLERTGDHAAGLLLLAALHLGGAGVALWLRHVPVLRVGTGARLGAAT